MQIRPSIFTGLIWAQAVLKHYQQIALADKEINDALYNWPLDLLTLLGQLLCLKKKIYTLIVIYLIAA